MFAEMRLAALLAKGTSGKADVLPAHQALEMATLNAAKALGIDAITGSLKSGKAADITAVNLSGLTTSPCYDAASHLVYTAGREHVSHVWTNGTLLLKEGELQTIDKQALLAKAAYWKGRIRP